jgi:hypothetical protein
MCRIAAIGDLVTHTRPQLECSAVTKFGIEFSLDNIQYVSEIAPLIRRIASAIFDQAHPQIADGEGAPGGLSRLAEMDGWRNSAPVCHRKWQRRDFHAVTPGFPSRIIERYVGYWKPYATKRILLIEAGP